MEKGRLMKQPEVEILVTCFVNFVFEIFHEIRRNMFLERCGSGIVTYAKIFFSLMFSFFQKEEKRGMLTCR